MSRVIEDTLCRDIGNAWPGVQSPPAHHRRRPRRTIPQLQTQLNEFRVRHDRINYGAFSLRVDGHLHRIGLGRTRVILLIDGYHVRVVHAATGEIIRTLTLDPERRYHGTGKPPGGPKGPRKTNRTGP